MKTLLLFALAVAGVAVRSGGDGAELTSLHANTPVFDAAAGGEEDAGHAPLRRLDASHPRIGAGMRRKLQDGVATKRYIIQLRDGAADEDGA